MEKIESPLLTIKEAADFLKLKPQTVRNYISRGFLPVRRNSETGTVRIHREDLENWLQPENTQPDSAH